MEIEQRPHRYFFDVKGPSVPDLRNVVYLVRDSFAALSSVIGGIREIDQEPAESDPLADRDESLDRLPFLLPQGWLTSASLMGLPS